MNNKVDTRNLPRRTTARNTNKSSHKEARHKNEFGIRKRLRDKECRRRSQEAQGITERHGIIHEEGQGEQDEKRLPGKLTQKDLQRGKRHCQNTQRFLLKMHFRISIISLAVA